MEGIDALSQPVASVPQTFVAGGDTGTITSAPADLKRYQVPLENAGVSPESQPTLEEKLVLRVGSSRTV